jgi:hypothetical protein
MRRLGGINLLESRSLWVRHEWLRLGSTHGTPERRGLQKQPPAASVTRGGGSKTAANEGWREMRVRSYGPDSRLARPDVVKMEKCAGGRKFARFDSSAPRYDLEPHHSPS